MNLGKKDIEDLEEKPKDRLMPHLKSSFGPTWHELKDLWPLIIIGLCPVTFFILISSGSAFNPSTEIITNCSWHQVNDTSISFTKNIKYAIDYKNGLVEHIKIDDANSTTTLSFNESDADICILNLDGVGYNVTGRSKTTCEKDPNDSDCTCDSFDDSPNCILSHESNDCEKNDSDWMWASTSIIVDGNLTGCINATFNPDTGSCTPDRFCREI